MQKADELVRAHVADPAAQSATVDRFLDELDEMAPSTVDHRDRCVTSRLRAASRDALATLTEEFDDVAGNLETPGSTTLADELARWSRCWSPSPRSTSTSPSPPTTPPPRSRLVERLFSGKVGDRTLDLLRTAVSQRWSAEADLVDGIEHTARLALLKRAELADEVDEVEEQLFRFGRVLDSEPRLTAC